MPPKSASLTIVLLTTGVDSMCNCVFIGVFFLILDYVFFNRYNTKLKYNPGICKQSAKISSLFNLKIKIKIVNILNFR